MRKYRVLISLMIMLVVMNMASLAFGGAASVYLPDSSGVQLNWEYEETPPKRPKPILLNSEKYEAKWRMDNPLLFGIVQDQNGILYSSDTDFDTDSDTPLNYVQAIYPNGKLKWRVQLNMGFELALIYLKLGQDGTIYAYSSDILSEPRLTSIYALSPEGKIKWKLLANEIISQFDDHFAGDSQGNFIYFSKDGLVSRNATGDINWIKQEITSSDGYKYWEGEHRSNVFVDAEGNIYVDTIDKKIISLDAKGSIRWTSAPQNYMGLFALFHPYFSNAGVIYLLTIDGLHALNVQDGSVLSMDHKSNLVDTRSNDLADIRSSGIPTDGRGGYYINVQGQVQKIDYTGKVIWRYMERDTEKYGIVGVEPLATDSQGNVYFPTGVGNIIGLNSDGQEVFAFLRNAYWNKSSQIVVGKNGNIYSDNHDIGLVAFGPKQIQVYKDNLYMPLSVAPIKDGGTVLVPFRSLFEDFGLTVGWDPASQTITGSREGLSIQLTLGSKTAYVNGKAKQLTAAPRTVHNSTYIPLRFVGEALGMNVSWDAKSSSVNMDSK